jgi:hypothetical protein
MHYAHGCNETNPLPPHDGIAIYSASNGSRRTINKGFFEMTASLSRFAYSSPVQAGERQTVRHIIGARRPQHEDSLKVLAAGQRSTRHKGAPSYAF